MDHRTRFTASLREALRGFVGAEQYRTHFPAQKIYPAFDAEVVQEMALLSFEIDSARFFKHTEDMLRACIDAEQFLVQAVTGAAVMLGDWWASDRLNYRAVELGSERLQDLVYDIADQRLLLVEPQEFVIDGQDVKEPIGMSGIRLEAKVHIVTGAQSAAENIIKCVRRCGLDVEQLMLNPLASSYSVLTADEKEGGKKHAGINWQLVHTSFLVFRFRLPHLWSKGKGNTFSNLFFLITAILTIIII